MNFRCPVCFFDHLPYPPEDYHICLCCGTEFGNDDQEHTLEELRSTWIADGAKWFYQQPPIGWSPWEQLFDAGRPDLLPVLPQISVYNFGWQNGVSNTIENALGAPLDRRELQLEAVR